MSQLTSEKLLEFVDSNRDRTWLTRGRGKARAGAKPFKAWVSDSGILTYDALEGDEENNPTVSGNKLDRFIKMWNQNGQRSVKQWKADVGFGRGTSYVPALMEYWQTEQGE